MIPVVFRYPNAKPLFIPERDWKPGGAPIQMYTLATELAKDSEFDVYFWFDDLPCPMEVEGVKLFSLQDPIRRGLPIVSRLINNKRKEALHQIIGKGVAIFTVCSNPIFIEYQSRIQAVGGKTIYRVASDIDVDEMRRQWPGSREFSEALKQADGVVAQTEFQQQKLLENFRKESVVIPPSFRSSDCESATRDLILWVGQCVLEKQPWIVLELARMFPSEDFSLIMPENDPKLAMALKSQAVDLPNVTIINYIPFDEIQSFYNRAKMVINTSMYEGFPNTLHQACIGGSPYVSLAWNPDCFFERTGVGLGSDNSVSKMIDHMRWLLENPVQSESMGQRAKEYFNANHRVEVVIEKYKDFIRKVTSQ